MNKPEVTIPGLQALNDTALEQAIEGLTLLRILRLREEVRIHMHSRISNVPEDASEVEIFYRNLASMVRNEPLNRILRATHTVLSRLGMEQSHVTGELNITVEKCRACSEPLLIPAAHYAKMLLGASEHGGRPSFFCGKCLNEPTPSANPHPATPGSDAQFHGAKLYSGE